MKQGAQTLNILGFSVNDDKKSIAPKSMKFGWFYVRVLEKIPPEVTADLANHGIKFRTQEMIQIGWFKKFLNEEQTSYIRNTNKFSLFDVKNYDKPDFKKLNDKTQLFVIATDDWVPTPPAAIVKREMEGYFTVSGQTAEKIFEDPYVCKVGEVPVLKPASP